MKARVACVQFESELMNKKKNINAIKEWTYSIKQKVPDIDLIVFPELTICGYECGDSYIKMAEEYPNGSSIHAVADIARKFSVHIVFGIAEKSIYRRKQLLFNTAVIVSDTGEIIGKYRKVHLVKDFETQWFYSGRDFPVFNTPFGRVGILICWDCAFPEAARILALKGAEIIAVPAAWERPKEDDWVLVQKARSFDNIIYIAASNWIGKDVELEFFGKSVITGPVGQIKQMLNDQIGMIWGELDLLELKKFRQGYYTQLTDRQVETYRELTKLK